MEQVLICTATTPAGSFFRLGRKWTKGGTLLTSDDISRDDLAVLMAEPHLNVRPATEEEIARLSPAEAQTTDVVLIDTLVSEIAAAPAEVFGKDGQPKLTELRKITALDPERLTGELRDAAMEKLKSAGFEAPVQGAG